MDKNFAIFLLNKVRDDYNTISKHFSETRRGLPKEYHSLAEYVKNGDKVLDIGCGNGRFLYALYNKDVDYCGIDASEEMIELAKFKFPKAGFLRADALDLPFENNSFDKIISMAVLHHIPCGDLRSDFMREARRVLKKDGLLVLTVWNLWNHKKPLILLLKYFVLKIIGRSKLDFKDIYYPWKDQEGNITADRYVHCFTASELKNLAESARFKIIKVWKNGKGIKSNISLVCRNDKEYHY